MKRGITQLTEITMVLVQQLLLLKIVLVTNNGATSGVVNWTPTAVGTYYYQCSVHDGMYGTITVQ